jgi:hypothetical protein
LVGISVFGIVIKEKMDLIESLLLSAIRPAILYNIFTRDLVSNIPPLTFTDLKMIRCLLGDPRMKSEDIAKSLFQK